MAEFMSLPGAERRTRLRQWSPPPSRVTFQSGPIGEHSDVFPVETDADTMTIVVFRFNNPGVAWGKRGNSNIAIPPRVSFDKSVGLVDADLCIDELVDRINSAVTLMDLFVYVYVSMNVSVTVNV